ncbi:MAG: universal stress protein [Vulcanimicrobiota bacterium]
MFPITRILCPTDFSNASYQAVEVANEMAKLFNSELFLLHVVSPVPVPSAPVPTMYNVPLYRKELADSAEHSLQVMVEEIVDENLTVHQVIIKGEPARDVVKFASENNIDLIVISSHSEEKIHDFLFGSVADKIIRTSSSPVLTIKPEIEIE